MNPFICVRGIQIFYAISGYNLNFTKNIYIKIILWIILALNLILVNFSFLHTNARLRNISTAQIAVGRYQTIAFWMYYHVLIFKVSKISSVISTLQPNLKYRDIKKCSNISLIVPMFAILGLLINIVVFDEILSDTRDRPGLLSHRIGLNDYVVSTITLIEMSKLNWSIISDIIYLLIYYILFRAKCSQLRMIHYSINSRDIGNILFSATNRIIDMHKQFESTMSIFPFLSISYLFFNVSQFYYYVGKAISSDHGHFLELWLSIFVIFRFLSFLVLVGIIDKYQNKLIDYSWDICKQINVNEDIGSTQRFSMTYLINTSATMPVTGWGMFTIDLSLILSFFSSLVTFTILFLDDHNNGGQSNVSKNVTTNNFQF